jgi:hypothetical protein
MDQSAVLECWLKVTDGIELPAKAAGKNPIGREPKAGAAMGQRSVERVNGSTDRAALLERWLKLTGPCHQVLITGFGSDRFRNPVEYMLRLNLAVLLDQLFGEWRPETVKVALADIVRIRTVQDASSTSAVDFVYQLRPLLRESGVEREDIVARIDQLILWAFEEYTRCRERIAEIRLRESRRAMGRETALHTQTRAWGRRS